jgi:hypothetical protein
MLYRLLFQKPTFEICESRMGYIPDILYLYFHPLFFRSGSNLNPAEQRNSLEYRQKYGESNWHTWIFL